MKGMTRHCGGVGPVLARVKRGRVLPTVGRSPSGTTDGLHVDDDDPPLVPASSPLMEAARRMFSADLDDVQNGATYDGYGSNVNAVRAAAV